MSVTDRRLRVTLRSGILAEVHFEHFGRILQPAFTSGTGEIWKEALAHLHMTVWPCPAFATAVLSIVPLHLQEPAPALQEAFSGPSDLSHFPSHLHKQTWEEAAGWAESAPL